jgi:hypothetical protein
MKAEYAGCQLVSIDEEIGIDGSLPALGEEAMQARITPRSTRCSSPVHA